MCCTFPPSSSHKAGRVVAPIRCGKQPCLSSTHWKYGPSSSLQATMPVTANNADMTYQVCQDVFFAHDLCKDIQYEVFNSKHWNTKGFQKKRNPSQIHRDLTCCLQYTIHHRSNSTNPMHLSGLWKPTTSLQSQSHSSSLCRSFLPLCAPNQAPFHGIACKNHGLTNSAAFHVLWSWK